MAKSRFVSYLRVSTARQGTSGLGLEAQRAAVAGFLNGGDWTLVQEVLEVESGKRNDRPALATALKLCRKHRATLVIAKLDRLARNVVWDHLKKGKFTYASDLLALSLNRLPVGPALQV
jgi:DNA invertase Pin-like site-specific DNA recombinase